MKKLLELLANNPAFAEINPQLRDALVSCASECSFKAGELIFTTGDPANEFFFIDTGCVQLTAHSPQKGPLHIQTLAHGDVLGWSWLFPPYTWHFDATAIEDTTAIKLDGRCVRGKCEQDYEFGYQLHRCFSQIMLERLLATRLQLLDLYGDAGGRGVKS